MFRHSPQMKTEGFSRDTCKLISLLSYSLKSAILTTFGMEFQCFSR